MPEKRKEKKSASGKPLGPIGTKVLFENEHIRVWSVELPGKGHQPLHEHEHPYLIVPVSEGKAFHPGGDQSRRREWLRRDDQTTSRLWFHNDGRGRQLGRPRFHSTRCGDYEKYHSAMAATTHNAAPIHIASHVPSLAASVVR
jgi:hypothetical protein